METTQGPDCVETLLWLWVETAGSRGEGQHVRRKNGFLGFLFLLFFRASELCMEEAVEGQGCP